MMDRISSFTLILILLFFALPTVAHPTSAIEIEEVNGLEIPSKILANFENDSARICFGTHEMTAENTSEISYSKPYSKKITYTKSPCEEGWQSFGFEFSSLLDLSNYSAISIRVYGACSISAWLSTSITDQAYEYLGLRSSTEPDKWTQLIWDLTATDVDLLNVTGITLVMDDEINTTRTFFLDDIELTTAAIYVPDDYPTIQDAVNAASDGDTIIVGDGTYIENVKVYKRLTIQSENGCDNCIVQAANSNYHVFGVSENYVNIRGFTVEGANRTVGSAGIYLGGVSHCHISNNKASKNDFGIYLDDSSSNMLTNNIANNNNFHGIYLYNSSNNSLTKNIAYDNNFHGVYLHDSSNNSISTNNAYNNDDTGICLDSSKKNILTKNTVYNNRWNGICLDDSGNNTLMNNIASNTHNGICLDNSSNTTLTNNTLSNNTYSGIWLNNSSNNLLMNNNAKNNLDGIALISSSNSSLMNNTVYNNTCSGFYLGDSSNNSLVNNNVYNNTHNGFYLTNSCSNSLMNNIAKNNSDGITLDNSSNTTLTNNTLSCNTYSGIWLKDTSSSNLLMNNNAKNNLDGVVLISSSNNSLMNNTVYNNTCSGFYLGDSSNNSLGNNTVYNNTHNGFYLTNSSSNSLTKNSVCNNIYNGFYLTNSSNNLLMNNNVKNNLNGIVLIYSNNNLIYHNNYIDNDNQSYDEAGTNLWNSSYPTGGNYWNDYNDNDAYSGPDQNLPGSDGIGDTPYNISGDAGAQDRYPFLNESGWLTGLTTITISPSTKTLYAGEKQWFTATAKDQNGDPVSGVIITWESSDTAVGIVCETSATTDSDGKATTTFTASATGTITVKATSGTVSETASVTVQRKVVAGGGGGGGGSVRQQTPTPTPTLPPSISDIISRELEKLSRGLILFNVPVNMTVDKKERIEVRITKNFTENLTEGLKGRGIPNVEKIMVNTFMKVDLTGNNFDIEPLSPEDQIVGIEGFTLWEWDVIPLEPGIQVLHFLVTVRIRISDHPPLDKACPVWDRYINVKPELEKGKTLVWDNDDKPEHEEEKSPVRDSDVPEPESPRLLKWLWLWVVAGIILLAIVILYLKRIKFGQKFKSWIKKILKIPVWLKLLIDIVWLCVLICTFLSSIILLLNFDHEWVWKLLLIIALPLSFIAGASNKVSDPSSTVGIVSFMTLLLIITIPGTDDLHIARLVITLLVIFWSIIIYKYSSWLLSMIRKRHLFSIDIDAQLEGELNEEIISDRLMNEFTKKEITLKEPNLRKEKNNKWKISDGEKIFILKKDKKEDKKLNIYR